MLTALIAALGVMLMPASTHVLLASPEPPAVVLTAVFVSRVTGWPATEKVVFACTTLVPADAEVITTVQVGAAAV